MSPAWIGQYLMSERSELVSHTSLMKSGNDWPSAPEGGDLAHTSSNEISSYFAFKNDCICPTISLATATCLASMTFQKSIGQIIEVKGRRRY